MSTSSKALNEIAYLAQTLEGEARWHKRQAENGSTEALAALRLETKGEAYGEMAILLWALVGKLELNEKDSRLGMAPISVSTTEAAQ